MTNTSTQPPTPAQTGTSTHNLTIPEDPFEGREFGGYVFRHRRERNFFIGRMTRREREKWLQDHPDRWQTHADFFRERQAHAGTDVEADGAGACLTMSANKVRALGASDGPSPAEDERQPDKPATNTAPQTIANPEAGNPATADDGDQIVINGRWLFGERSVAKMLGRSMRTLQRWRKEGKGPPSTTIGRKVFYELNDLQEWIDRGKIR